MQSGAEKKVWNAKNRKLGNKQINPTEQIYNLIVEKAWDEPLARENTKVIGTGTIKYL